MKNKQESKERKAGGRERKGNNRVRENKGGKVKVKV